MELGNTWGRWGVKIGDDLCSWGVFVTLGGKHFNLYAPKNNGVWANNRKIL
jgi:hypothetical protein